MKLRAFSQLPPKSCRAEWVVAVNDSHKKTWRLVGHIYGYIKLSHLFIHLLIHIYIYIYDFHVYTIWDRRRLSAKCTLFGGRSRTKAAIERNNDSLAHFVNAFPSVAVLCIRSKLLHIYTKFTHSEPTHTSTHITGHIIGGIWFIEKMHAKSCSPGQTIWCSQNSAFPGHL